MAGAKTAGKSIFIAVMIKQLEQFGAGGFEEAGVLGDVPGQVGVGEPGRLVVGEQHAYAGHFHLAYPPTAFLVKVGHPG